MASALCSQILACRTASELTEFDSCLKATSLAPLDQQRCIVHRISLNDPTVEELNIVGTRLFVGDEGLGIMAKLCSGLICNTHLRKLRLVNVGLRATSVASLADVLRVSKIITHVDIESNQLADMELFPLVEAVGCSQVLEELRLNQGTKLKNRELVQALVAAARNNSSLVKISAEYGDVPSCNQVDSALMRNSRRRVQAATISKDSTVGQHARNEIESQILGCTSLMELTNLVKQEPKSGTKTWLIWMVHRVFLNDPLLKSFDATRAYGTSLDKDPVIFPKLAASLGKNTHLECLFLSNTGFREAEALAASLLVNHTLRILDINRTRLSSLELILIANAVASSGSLVELRCNSTVDLGQGHKATPVWQAMLNAVKTNTNLCKLVLDVSEDQHRRSIQEQLARNAAAMRSRKMRAKTTEPEPFPALVTAPVQAGSFEDEASEAARQYASAVVEPAEKSFSRDELRAMSGTVVEVLPGRCWVVPCVMTASECSEWVRKGDQFGLEQNHTATSGLRTNSRTKDFVHVAMARLLRERLPNELISAVAASNPQTEVRSVYEELRVTRYTVGQLFRPHFDDSTFRPEANENGERGETSTHTVLAILSEDFEGGATRFWPTGSYKHAVDVTAPLGSVLVFEQRTLLHEGMAITAGVKHVAQSGLMRAPNGTAGPQPVLFQWGPGVSLF